MNRNEIFKLIPVGTEVNLVKNITGEGLGPRVVDCIRKRTLPPEIGMKNGSWLALPDSFQYVKTEQGFMIFDEKGRLMAEYEIVRP